MFQSSNTSSNTPETSGDENGSVPGPEDKIAVRLIDGVLYIRGSQGFSKEVQIEGPKEMEIGDFKYRNGVLTLRIKTSEAL